MNRFVVLVLALLAFLPGSSRAQEEGSVAAALRCVNCDDPELLAWLQPIDPEAPRFTCALTMALAIEADGLVAEAYPVEEEVPPLCEQRATLWARATRWSVERGAPITANLPLEFAIERTIEPKCLDGCDFHRVIEELRRAGSIRRGLECETTLGLKVDIEGRVIDTRIEDGDRDQVCVLGLSRWARGTRWSIPYEGGDPVVTWIEQAVRFSTR